MHPQSVPPSPSVPAARRASRVPKVGRVFASLVAALALSVGADARQAGPSSGSVMFVPSNRVPLSEFKVKNGNIVTLHVDPDVLTWIAAQPGASLPSSVQVAVRKANGQIVYPNATSANTTTGEVKLNQALLLGDCVATTTLLRQETDIVTHWNAEENWDEEQDIWRGGQEPEAKDGLATIDVNTSTGELVSSTAVWANLDDPADAPTEWEWFDPDHEEAGPYVYRSDRYALYDDGSDTQVDAILPAYERYIAENYTLYKPTAMAAIWLSDRVRSVTGFPIAHRNGYQAFDSGAGAGQKVEDGLPLFQVVHARIEHFEDTEVAGYEDSLATFVLPPGWTSASSEATYPILFNGQYDVHQRCTFAWENSDGRPDWGKTMFTALGELYDHAGGPRRAVGIFWNGGGAGITYTQQASAYENIEVVIDDAAANFDADRDRIVFTGGSRGGMTALAMGSNPFEKNYTAVYLNAYTPVVRLGTSIEFSNPSYPLGLGSTPAVTGWKNSWMSDWVDPNTELSGLELTAEILFGVTNYSAIDEFAVIDSEAFIDGLLEQGTGVVLRYGTHDGFKAFDQIARYYEHLRDAGVPIQLDVFHRFGHQIPRDRSPSEADLLNAVLGDSFSITPRVEHYGRDAADFTIAHHLLPDDMPLVYERPLAIGAGQMHSLSFVGKAGGRVLLRAAFVGTDFVRGVDCQPDPGDFVTKLGGSHVLEPEESGDEFGYAAFWQPATSTNGWYWNEVLYDPDDDGTYEFILGSCASSSECGPTECGATGPYYGISAPTYEQPLYWVAPVPEVLGTEDNSRTGGLALDDQVTVDPYDD